MRKLSTVEIKAIRGSAGMSQERLRLRQLRNKIHSMRERFPARKTRQIVRGFQGEIAEFLAWIFNKS